MDGDKPEITIHARPGLNGSPPKHFLAAAYSFHGTARRIEEDILRHMVELFRGRNYQHLEDAEARRSEDRELLANLAKAQILLREVGDALGQIGAATMDCDT